MEKKDVSPWMTVKFKIPRDCKALIDEAMKKAGRISNSKSEGHNLILIMVDYLAGPG